MSWELILKKYTLKVDILNRFKTALETHYDELGVDFGYQNEKINSILRGIKTNDDLISRLKYWHKLAKNSADKDMFGKVRADGDSKGKQYRKLENTLQGLLGGL